MTSAALTTLEQGEAAIAVRTNMTRREVADWLACNAAQQQLIVETTEHMQWTQNRDTVADVLAILTAMASIAGAVSGIGTAIGILKAL